MDITQQCNLIREALRSGGLSAGSIVPAGNSFHVAVMVPVVVSAPLDGDTPTGTLARLVRLAREGLKPSKEKAA